MADAVVSEGFIPFRGYRTWYRILGDVDNVKRESLPLLLLHGGPGIPHESLEPIGALAAQGRPVIFYDQLGCGNSDRPDDPAIWGIDLFREELQNLCRALDLRHVHILGHSWGGMLAIDYALTKPATVASLVLHSTFASAPPGLTERERFYERIPAEIAEPIRRHEAAKTTDHPEYLRARQAFDERYTCRISPLPGWYQAAVAKANWDVNFLMWAPGGLHPEGLLRQWDRRSRLHEVDVPVLITAGCHDGWVPGQAEILHASIPHAELHYFENSAHYAHAGENAAFLALVEAFCKKVERGG